MSQYQFFSEDFIKKIQLLQEEMVGTIKPLLTQIERTNTMLNQVSASINFQLFDAVLPAINSIDWSNIKRIYDSISEYAKVVNKFSLIMIEMDWPPPLDVSPSIMRNIIEKYEESNSEDKAELKKYTDVMISNCYSEEILKDKLDSWRENKWLIKRIGILEEVVKAHTEKRYILSIPTMLPQIEGIIADGFGHEGRLSGRKLKVYIERLLERGLSIDDCVEHFVFSVVLVIFEFGKPINSSLSRHAILHGADTEYATSCNSLKSIILFDYIQDAFVYVLIEGSDIYHTINCFVLDNSRKPRRIFRNTDVLDELEKKPCKLCLKIEK